MGGFLPTTHEEMTARGWRQADIVLVTGDAYVDHPSFGVAVIGRWLEAHGYRVCVLVQPRHDSPDAFRLFGKPRLFFGISAGNLDSIVANYSGNGRVRDHDDYSPDGNPYFGAERNRMQRRRPSCTPSWPGLPTRMLPSSLAAWKPPFGGLCITTISRRSFVLRCSPTPKPIFSFTGWASGPSSTRLDGWKPDSRFLAFGGPVKG
jgi:hypothetical protein